MYPLILPCAGPKVNAIIKTMNNSLKHILPNNTGRRIIERSADHCVKDKQLHPFRHGLNNNNKTVDLKDFKIIDSSYHNNRFKRKISEALYIKQYKPSLSTQQQSAQLKLFN